MALVKDLSGNGTGVSLNQRGKGDLINIGGGDFTINNAARIRVGGAGNLILRYPNSTADITIAAGAGEYVPVFPGTIVRSTSTATTLQSISDQA